MNTDKQDTAKILPQEKIKDTAEFSGDEQSADYADFADFVDSWLEKRRMRTRDLKRQEEQKSPEMNADKQDSPKILRQEKIRNTKGTALVCRLQLAD